MLLPETVSLSIETRPLTQKTYLTSVFVTSKHSVAVVVIFLVREIIIRDYSWETPAFEAVLHRVWVARVGFETCESVVLQVHSVQYIKIPYYPLSKFSTCYQRRWFWQEKQQQNRVKGD